MNQPPWIALAWAELGQREIAGAGSNPRIADYFRRIGQPGHADDATAWCAAFVGACLEAAGLESTHSLLARSYLAWGVAADAPVLGAVAILSRGSDPALGHVGFLVGLTGTHAILLGGNQSDAVTVAAFERRRVLGFRLPAGANVKRAAEPDTGFAAAVPHILAFEGGWSDDPFDPGGPTNKGITLAVYARERGEDVTSGTVARLKSELRQIPESLAHRIYRDRYWLPAGCPDLPAGLAFFHFDAAVNQGVGTAARLLQEALGVMIDGEIGPQTLEAARSRPLERTLDRYAEIRRRHYRALAHFWRFGQGWLARVDAALVQARALASSRPSQPSKPDQQKEKAAMAPIEIPTSPPDRTQPREAKWWGESLTIWGALLTALTTVAPALLAAFGIDVSIDLVQRLGRDVVAVAQAVAGLVGTAMTIFGRMRATSRLERRAMNVRI